MQDKQAELFDYDVELHRYHDRLAAALDVGRSDHVLDIGCGSGQTTRVAARAAATGSVLGVDVSEPRLARARQLAEDDGLTNIQFVQADAQDYPFLKRRFDLALSRFGTMFFADPVAAFTNIGAALRPGARLVQLVWQSRDRQEWIAMFDEVFGPQPAPEPAVDAFSLGDPATVEVTMTAAGFADMDVLDVHEPVFYGTDVDSALRFLLTMDFVKGLLAGMESERAAAALDHLRTRLRAHHGASGVLVDSQAWLVTAHRSRALGREADGASD